MKDCPFCSTNKDRPAVEMNSLRDLLLMIWRMELAQKGLLVDGYDSAHDPLAAPPDSEIPLSGLQVKIVDIHLQIARLTEYVEQLLNPAARPDDPLYLMRHSQIQGKLLDKKL